MQVSYPVCGSEGFSPVSLTVWLLPPLAAEVSVMAFWCGGASTEGHLVSKITLPFGFLTAVEENMHRMSDSFERDGAQWQLRIRCLSRSVQRCGEFCMDRSPGELQGSDRVEVWAVLQLLERTLRDLVIGTECDHVVKCFRTRWWERQGCRKNGDLWCRIGVALKRKRRVTVCKVACACPRLTT